MTFRIIPITEGHVEGFHAVIDVVSRERVYLAYLEAPPLKEIRAFVRGNIKRGTPQYAAVVEEQVVGWCDIVPIARQVKAHGGILGVSVLPEYRGRGIGTALITETIAKARLIGLTRVELTVRENNKKALVLYQRLGFVVEGLKRKAVYIDGEYEDLVCMGLLLD